MAIIDETPTENPEFDSEDITYQPNEEVDDDSNFDQEEDDVEFNYIRRAPSTRLYVIRCAFSQLAKENDCRRTVIFHILTKIRSKNCKVIMDSENCINAVLSKVIEKVGLKVVPHLHPYKKSWINSTILDVK